MRERDDLIPYSARSYRVEDGMKEGE